GVQVRREVEVSSGEVRVVDQVLDGDVEQLQVTWLLASPEMAANVEIDGAIPEFIDAAEGDVTGWFAPTYGLRVPSTAIRVRQQRSGGDLRLLAVIRQRG